MTDSSIDSRTPLGQSTDPPFLITPHPSVEALATDTKCLCCLGNCQAVPDHGQDSVITCSTLLSSTSTRPPPCVPKSPGRWGQGVKSDTVRISRYSLTHQALSKRDTSGVYNTDTGWGRQGSNLRPRDYESPALTTELLPLNWVFLPVGCCPSFCPSLQFMTGTIRERSPGHFELRAYNVATDRQVTKTYKHPSKLQGVGIKEAKRRLAKLVDDVAAGKYGVKTDPEEIVTLSKLLDEWIAHGESRGRSPNTLHGYRSKRRGSRPAR